MANFDEAFDKILKIDPRIRYVGIYYQGKYNSKAKTGLKSLLEEGEIKKSVINAVKRWETRLAHAKNLGDVIYSLTKYEKVNRVTIPLGEDGLIMASTETDLDPNFIAYEIRRIGKKSFNS